MFSYKENKLYFTRKGKVYCKACSPSKPIKLGRDMVYTVEMRGDRGFIREGDKRRDTYVCPSCKNVVIPTDNETEQPRENSL